jgi:hypothetical protein
MGGWANNTVGSSPTMVRRFILLSVVRACADELSVIKVFPFLFSFFKKKKKKKKRTLVCDAAS